MRNILIMTVGDTPQIVTETLYALLTARDPWIPDEIRLLTTGFAARRFREGVLLADPEQRLVRKPLIGVPNGKLFQLYRELGMIAHYVEPEVWAQIEDLRTPSDANAFAWQVLTDIMAATAHPDTNVHLSLAGGRKTMSVSAATVMAIGGRVQDCMSHTLLECADPVRLGQLENCPTFWWPNQSEPALDRAGQPIDLTGVGVTLCRLPFIRTSAFVDRRAILPPGKSSFAEVVERANDGLSADRVTIDLIALVVSSGQQCVEMPAAPISALALTIAAHKLDLDLVRGRDNTISLRPRKAGDTPRLRDAGREKLLSDLWKWTNGVANRKKLFDNPEMWLEANVFDLHDMTDRLTLNFNSYNSGRSRALELLETFPQLLADRILMAPKGKGNIISLPPANFRIILPEVLAGRAPWERG